VICGGRLRGLRLAVPEGRSTRPTRSRVREALFSIVAERLPDARVADLYAGSGALGLEALSRGAAHATFVEHDPRALACLRRNLQAARLQSGQFELLVIDAQLLQSEPGSPFDLVLVDPPFALRDPLPRALLQPGVLASEALLVIEQPSERIAPLRLGALELRASRPYGSSSLWIYSPAGSPQDP
jgi:16S rRNA (guanine966-N2)-methyltransferase